MASLRIICLICTLGTVVSVSDYTEADVRGKRHYMEYSYQIMEVLNFHFQKFDCFILIDLPTKQTHEHVSILFVLLLLLLLVLNLNVNIL